MAYRLKEDAANALGDRRREQDIVGSQIEESADSLRMTMADPVPQTPRKRLAAVYPCRNRNLISGVSALHASISAQFLL
jgi:hypothetical protein